MPLAQNYHPTLHILLRSDGLLCLPPNRRRKTALWTYGTLHHSGYRQITIAKKTYLVHRLMAEAFIQYPIPDGYEVDHLDRHKSNNALSNLRVCSKSENARNTAPHDRVSSRNDPHTYEDPQKYRHNRHKRLYADPEYRSKVLKKNHDYFEANPERQRAYNHAYNATEHGRENNRNKYLRFAANHKRVRCADGKNRWFTNEEANELLLLPVKDRILPH